MVKIYCDICGGDAFDDKFMAELMVKSIEHQITMPNINPVPRMVEKRFQFCNGCYKGKIEKLFNNGKENTEKK